MTVKFSKNFGAEINNTLPSVVSTIEISAPEGTVVNDIDVPLLITHTWIGDLQITLESPSGTSVSLWGGFCGGTDNLNFTADDEGMQTVACADFATSGANLMAMGLVPNPALSIFDGENPNGTWTLTIDDTFAGDNGTLDNFQMIMDLDYPDDVLSDNCGVVVAILLFTAFANESHGTRFSCSNSEA